MQIRMMLSLLPVLATLLCVSNAPAAEIIGGYTTMTLDEGVASSIGYFDAYFDETATRAQTLSLPSPGNASFVRLTGTPGPSGTPGTVQIVDPIRPFGAPFTAGSPGAARTQQGTTLDVDPGNVLGSWTASTDQFGVFVPTGVGSEQIAFTSMQRWGGPFTGSLLYGDFGLRYLPGRDGVMALDGELSGLVLASNIDFLNSSWADIANATINVQNNQLLINGDLLISGALNVLDPTAIVGTKFGTFSMVAYLEGYAVPEPSSLAIVLVMGVIAVAGHRFVAARKAKAQGKSS